MTIDPEITHPDLNVPPPMTDDDGQKLLDLEADPAQMEIPLENDLSALQMEASIEASIEENVGESLVISTSESLALESASLFPVQFSLENYDFDEAAFDEIELIRSPEVTAKIEVEGEMLDSISQIPKKLAFKIGEVAEMVGVKQYVLRYWETEFDQLRPKKSKFNQRVYTRKDVETALLIKKLLYKDRFSIEGARSALRGLREQVRTEQVVRKQISASELALDLTRALIDDIRSLRQRL